MHIDPKTWWYVSRASGYVAWALLALSILWGLFITNKTLQKSTPPAWVLDLHRHLGGLAAVFVVVHLGVLPLDAFTSWGWQDLVVPMHSSWHPGPIAWGIVAMYLLFAIEVTSLLGRRFPKKWWRRVHMLSFPLYVVASIHLFAAGTDAHNVVVRWMVVIVSTLVVFLAGVRGLGAAKPRETRPRVPARAAARPDPVVGAPADTATSAPTPEPTPAPGPAVTPEPALALASITTAAATAAAPSPPTSPPTTPALAAPAEMPTAPRRAPSPFAVFGPTSPE